MKLNHQVPTYTHCSRLLVTINPFPGKLLQISNICSNNQRKHSSCVAVEILYQNTSRPKFSTFYSNSLSARLLLWAVSVFQVHQSICLPNYSQLWKGLIAQNIKNQNCQGHMIELLSCNYKLVSVSLRIDEQWNQTLLVTKVRNL